MPSCTRRKGHHQVEAGNGCGDTASGDVGSICLIRSHARSDGGYGHLLLAQLDQRPWVHLDASLPDTSLWSLNPDTMIWMPAFLPDTSLWSTASEHFCSLHLFCKGPLTGKTASLVG